MGELLTVIFEGGCLTWTVVITMAFGSYGTRIKILTGSSEKGATTFCVMTLSMTTFSITTLSINGLL
jgi:hypothetical protein